MGHGSGRMNPINGHKDSRGAELVNMLKRLRKLGSSPLCDADKVLRLRPSSDDTVYAGLSLMCPNTMKLRNPSSSNDTTNVMVGVARTVQLNKPNDFLGVLDALTKLRSNDVLLINSGGSTRAVAGGLFSAEASRRGVSGIIVDGPIRDVDDLDHGTKVFSTAVSPYAGTIQHPGDGIDSHSVICGGVTVNPGDIVFGDRDGVLVGSADTFFACLHDAENIVAVEQHLMEGMKLGVSLHSMTNFDDHMRKRKAGKESSLDFKVRNTIKFEGVDPVNLP
jgi:regulator of RNase E activity RraA|eukprot:scaffold16_cov190-Alexandrium_tamarense.AAC.12